MLSVGNLGISGPGRKAFLPVESPPQADLSFLFLLGASNVRLIPLLYQVSGHRQMYFRPAEASPAQEYRLRLKRRRPLSRQASGVPSISILNPVSFLAALALPGLLPRVALLTLRFRFEKYAQHTFRPKPNVEKTPAALKASPLCCGSRKPTNQSTNMNTALNSNSTRSRVPGTIAISDEEIRRFAPSVFASQPIEGVSERYRFLPTSSILNGMRENGWVPVRAQEQSIRTEARHGFQKHVVRFARLQHLQTWEKNEVRPEVVLLQDVMETEPKISGPR
jgi:Domain of unknown function (DUF932)